MVLPLSLLMLWTATPAQADDWSRDLLPDFSDVSGFILKLISSAGLSMADDFIPKPPPPPETPPATEGSGS